MNLSRIAGTIAVASGLFSAGCLGTTDDIEGETLGVATLRIDGPIGSGGHNGLHPAVFHFNKSYLKDITFFKLVSSGGTGINPSITGSNLFDTPESRLTFQYAMQCALPKGFTLTDTTYGSYPGYGHLPAAQAWLTSASGLAANVRNDLFACMLAHLNPGQMSVDIRLTGPNAWNNDNDFDPTPFGFQEALWVAQPNSAGAFDFHVWPLPDLIDKCQCITSDLVKYRVCGEYPGDCGLFPEEDLNDCVKDNGVYTCNGQPAIQTWLTTSGADTLYARCNVPLDCP